MALIDYIQIKDGVSYIRNTTIPIIAVINLLQAGSDVFQAYPELTKKDLDAIRQIMS